jgi:hypothetical protein
LLSLLIDRNYLAAKWYGFVDSQSGIDIYVIRVGKAHGSGDIMSSTVVTETDAKIPQKTQKPFLWQNELLI